MQTESEKIFLSRDLNQISWTSNSAELTLIFLSTILLGLGVYLLLFIVEVVPGIMSSQPKP